MPGDLAWRLPDCEPDPSLALFHDQQGLAGYAWFDPPTDFEYDLRDDLAPEHPLHGVILSWAEACRRTLPAGCRLRSVGPEDVRARVEVHRAAWPGSSFSVARYRAIRALSVYEPELDIVLDDGELFASYCICWADDCSGVGIFEPVGTRDSWRGRGAARCVIMEGLRRLRERGMAYAQVQTPVFNAPARALYESCGFTQLGRARTFMKVIH